MEMKSTAIFIIALMAVVITASEARLFNRRKPGIGRGNWNDEVNGCPRCPRLSRRSRVCASTERFMRTFSSACAVDRMACRTKRNITIIADGPCTQPAAPQVAGGQSPNTESRSSESLEVTSNELDGDMGIVPVRTTAVPPQPPTNRPSPLVTSGVAPPSLPPAVPGTRPPATGSGTQPPVPPQANPSGTPSVDVPPPTESQVVGVPPPARTPFVGRQCPTMDSCAPSSFVCGTDGLTYKSQCILDVTACNTGQDTLTVAYAGECL